MNRNRIIAGIVVLLLLAGLAAKAQGLGWALVNAKIRHDFPGVKRISTTELAGWLSDKTRPAPLLLDVRTKAEFAVSHLQNAEQIDPAAPASIISQPHDRPIVTYCSVGYRSGEFAQRLQAAGFNKVLNLEGSIFRWANEGRPLFRGERRVTKVHPYNRVWGLLVRKEHRAEVSAAE